MKSFKVFFFLLFACFKYGIFSTNVLKKYSSTKTSNNYVIFESSEFKIGDKMYFEIESSNNGCSEYLYYDYYDDIYSVNILDKPLNFVKKDSSSTTSVNGRITSYTLYFTIKKEREELNGLSGNYLFMNFDCLGSVEIKNTKISGITKTLIIVFVVLAFFILLFIIIFVCYCKKRRAKMYIPPVNPVYPVIPYYIQVQPMNQAQYPYPYQTPIPNMVYNNPNLVNIAPNAEIYQNGAVPQVVEQPTSNREIYSQQFEKPKA